MRISYVLLWILAIVMIYAGVRGLLHQIGVLSLP